MNRPSFRVPVPTPLARGLLVVVAAVSVATCRLGDIIGRPQGALLAVDPAMPDSLKDAAPFGSTAPRSDPINIENKGDGDLKWSAHTKHASPWVSLDPDTGTAGQTPTLQVIFDPAGLAIGVYEDTVVVLAVSGTASFEVPLWFNVHTCDIAPISLDDSVSTSLTTADCGAPHRPGHFAKLYNFSGIVPDSVSVEMVAGFDGYVALDSSLATNQAPLAQANDCLGTPGDPCLYYTRLPRNATYFVEVTSADSADTGSFKVRLVHPRPPDTPTSLDQRLNDSVTSVPVGNTVNALSLLLRAVVSDPDLGDSLHLEAEVRPIGVAFSGPNVPNGPKVANGQAAWVSTGTLTDEISYHWRVRAGDNTGRQGPWASLAGGTDFTINVPHAPDAPTALAQSKPDGTPINVGGTADTDVVVFSASVSDQDPGDQLRLQVEVKPVGTAFSNSPTDSSPSVASGIAQVSVQNGNNTNYHWQARVTDQTGLASAWTKFGNNAESATDFRVQLANVPNAPTALLQFQSDGATSIPVGGVTAGNSVVLKGSVSDPDVGQAVQLDVEVKPTTVAFTNVPNYSSTPVTNPAQATVSVGPLANNTPYHWQARAKDATNRTSAWVSFPQPTPNPETDADFSVQQPPTELFFSVQPPLTATAGAALAPPIQVQARGINHHVATGFTGNVVMTLENAPGATLSGTTTVPAVNGVALFSNLIITKAGSGYTLRATTAVPSLTQPSNAFTIAPAATSQLVFTTNPPASTTAGAAMTPAVVVTAEDNFGNTTPSYGTGVTLSIANNAGNPPGTLTGGGPVIPSSGVATFSGVSIDKTGNGYTLRASSGALPQVTSTAFNITAGPPTKLAFTVSPGTTAANATITPPVQVSALDVNNNLATGFSSNVTVAIGTNPPGNGILSGTKVVAAVAGVASFSTLSIDKFGLGYTLTSNATGLTGATSAQFDIVNSPISPALSTVVANPTTITASNGASQTTITVTARDGANNLVSGASATISVTGTGNTVTPAGAVITNGSGVATWTLSSTAAEGKTVSAVISLISITQTATVTVNSGLATTLVPTTQPTNTTAGVAINSGSGGVVITAHDQFGNTATGFASQLTMVLGANPAGGVLSGTVIATPTQGVATFGNLRIAKAGGGYQLQASGGSLTSPLSNAFTINAAPAHHLTFTTQPTNTAVLAKIDSAIGGVVVTVQDSVNNTVPFGGTVRIIVGNNAGGGTLSGGGAISAPTGIATFPNLTLNALGSGYTLVTTSSGPALISDESNPFDIIPGPAKTLSFTVQPTQTVAGQIISPAVKVTALDVQGNVATGFGGNVTMAIGTNPGGGALSGGGATAAVSGVATFSALSINNAGPGYTLVASTPALPSGPVTSGTSNPFNIVSGGVSATLSTIARNPTSITASAPTAPITSTITVTAKDGLGNPISGLPVVLSATGSGNTLTQPVANTDINGQATGTISSTVAESKTISATINGTLINATMTVVVNPAAAKQLVFVSQPTNTVATQTIKAGTGVTVEVRDTFNNRVTGAGNSVNVSILNNAGTPVPGTLSGTTPRTPSAGVVTFNDLSIDRTGTGYTLLTSSAGLVSDTSAAFNIVVGAATHLGFVQQPTQTAGGATITPAVTVEILDAGGNRVNSTANVTVALANNPGGLGSLGGTKTVAAAGGLATFSTLSIDHAAAGYTLGATSGSLTGATSNAFDIVVGAPAKLVFGQQPTSAVAGVAISPSVTVRILDAGNNLVTSASNSISIAIQNNAGGGSLSGTLSHNASGGIATFNDLSIDKAGTGYTLSATGVGPGVTSTTFNISHAGADHLVFTTQPANTQAGQTMPSVVLEIRDAFDNLVTNATDQVTLAITSGTGTAGAVLSGTIPKAAVGGIVTFTDLSIDLSGNQYTLDASAAGMTGMTSSQFNITP